MNDSKIKNEYRDKYHDFINNEIIPTINETMVDVGKISLSVRKPYYDRPFGTKYQDYSFGMIPASITVRLYKRESSEWEEIKYTSGKEYQMVLSKKPVTVEVSNQNSFFDFVAICINRGGYTSEGYGAGYITKEDLFNLLRGFIDDKRYVNQRKAAFEPSKFPEMNIWRQSEYYNFVDSEFKKKLFEDESKFIVEGGHKFLITDGGRIHLGKASEEELGSKIAITDMDLKLQFVRFRVEGHKKPYVYTSSSKYYKSVTSDLDAMLKYSRVDNIERVDASKIANNDPYFMFILRCLNKDKKVLEPVLRYGQSVQYKEFTQRELSAYFDGFISNDKYKNEYDITFVPVEVNPGVDESSKEKYVDFINNEIKPKIKDMWMVSADDDSVFFARHYGTLTVMGSKIDNTPGGRDGADVVFIPNSKLNSYKKKHGQKVYGIPNNLYFKFMQECLSRNGTESKWIKFEPTREEHSSGNNKDLVQSLEKLLFYQQCKEDYLNNFHLPGSSSSGSAMSKMSPPQIVGNALLGFWLYKVILQPFYSYISNKISGQVSDKPSSNITEVREQQLDKKGIIK